MPPAAWARARARSLWRIEADLALGVAPDIPLMILAVISFATASGSDWAVGWEGCVGCRDMSCCWGLAAAGVGSDGGRGCPEPPPIVLWPLMHTDATSHDDVSSAALLSAVSLALTSMDPSFALRESMVDTTCRMADDMLLRISVTWGSAASCEGAGAASGAGEAASAIFVCLAM